MQGASLGMFTRVRIIDKEHIYNDRAGRITWVNGDSASFDVLLEDTRPGEIASPKCKNLLPGQIEVIGERRPIN